MMDVLISETCWTQSEIKLNKMWHQVGLLFFKYHNDAQTNTHKSLSGSDTSYLSGIANIIIALLKESLIFYLRKRIPNYFLAVL